MSTAGDGAGCEVPAFVGTTVYLRRNDAYNTVRAGAAMAQWAFVALLPGLCETGGVLLTGGVL